MIAFGWRGAWRIAWRDLSGGLRGLRLLFTCLLLGVATLAAIGSLTAAITRELASRGQAILGGDIEIGMTQRELTERDKASLRTFGRMSETIRMRAMAMPIGKGTSQYVPPVLTELKGVDSAYPLYGSLKLQHAAYVPLASDKIVISPALSARLGVGIGDRLRYGEALFVITDLIADEPDRVGEGFTLGPVAIVSLEGLRRSGLIQPGSLLTSKYRLRLAAGQDAHALRGQLEKVHAADGWEFKDRDKAAPGTDRFIGRMSEFLSLIGLTALIVAGIGVSNGVASYLALRRGTLATLKILGATSGDIERIYLLQVGAVAAVSIVLGLAVGAASPLVIIAWLGDALPVQPGFHLHLPALLTSALYGLLIAFIFTLPPLARARTEPVATIFRALVIPQPIRDRRTLLWVVLASFAVIGLVLSTAREQLFAASVLSATAAVVCLLMALGRGVIALAKRLPRPRQPLLRLAISNLYRPGAQTSALVIALGLALTLFVMLAAIETSLEAEIERTVPKRAPSLFVLDLPSNGKAKFRSIVEHVAPRAPMNIVPSLRGRVVTFGNHRVADLQDLPEGAWALRGERGVTYSARLPEGSELVAGQWWPENYQGPPLLSLDAEQAKAMGLSVGDPLTISVLGREIGARIGSLRKINWDTMGFNYVFVFSPHTLASAPHSLTATIILPPSREAQVTQTLLASFPGASVIAVSEMIERVSGILDQMATAIIASGSITILAGIAVLIGAIAASRQARSYDSVVFKMLGATRFQILATQAVEYSALATIVAVVSLALGLIGAWFVITQIFEFTWAPDWILVAATLGTGAILTLGVGLAGSLPLMSVRSASALRHL